MVILCRVSTTVPGQEQEATYYVQTNEVMKTQLMEQGLGDSDCIPAVMSSSKGDEKKQLCIILAPLEEALITLARPWYHSARSCQAMTPEWQVARLSRLSWQASVLWFATSKEVDAFVEESM